MVLLNFEYYLSKGLVKKRRKDTDLASSLVNSSRDRMKFSKEIMKSRPRYALEMAYESVIELIEALLALEGLKSWSHEANIVFLLKVGFIETDIARLDLSRRKRHSSKYYGISFTPEEAKEEIEYLGRVFNRILSKIKTERRKRNSQTSQ